MVVRAAARRTILDRPQFRYFNQRLDMLAAPLEVAPGEPIVTECGWRRDRPSTIMGGPSALEEMCMAFVLAVGVPDASIERGAAYSCAGHRTDILLPGPVRVPRGLNESEAAALALQEPKSKPVE